MKRLSKAALAARAPSPPAELVGALHGPVHREVGATKRLDRLRECPFCGSSNVDLWCGQSIGNRPDNGMRFATCLHCGASTSCRERAEAVSSWNTRPEQDRLRVAAEKLAAFVIAKGQEHEENARGRTNTQSKTYDEERALVCWQVLDEIEALFQGVGDTGRTIAQGGPRGTKREGERGYDK